MPFNQADTVIYRRDVAAKGEALTSKGRERLLAPYLPPPPTNPSTGELESSPKAGNARKRGHRKRVRPWLKNKIYILLQFLVQLFFGFYIRLRKIFHATLDRITAIRHHHHRTPEYIQKDVKNLSRIPEHLSVILKFKAGEDNGLETLMDEVADLCTWSAAAGIGLLSVYEKSGILKNCMGKLEKRVNQKLASYFGPPPVTPSLRLFSPNHSSMNPIANASLQSPTTSNSGMREERIDLLLLSATDGRETLVDLTRTLTEMSQAQKIKPKDITSELINTEIVATTAIPSSPGVTGEVVKLANREVDAGEPDLLVIFGPYVKLDGYPPWQVRLTEIFCVGDSGADVSGNTTRVEYQGFLRGLWKYAGAEQRFGR